MKRSGWFFMPILLVCSYIHAQNQTPTVLREAAQCLVTKSFLKPSILNLGYTLDSKSWPGENVLYVVAYTGQTASKGYVFTFFLEQKANRTTFHIQNNAKFIRSKKSPDGVDFVEVPLGGIWTQNHLVSAIKQIEKQPRFVISSADLSSPAAGECISYADLK